LRFLDYFTNVEIITYMYINFSVEAPSVAFSPSSPTVTWEAAFTGGNRSPANGDQIVVTYSLSAASVN